MVSIMVEKILLNGTIPFKNLGAMIGSSPYSRSFWKPLVQKIQQKIGSYDVEKISVAGRLVILKVVIDSIPIY